MQASVNTVIGGAGGAVVGQIAIPVPVLGAAVGGVTGSLLGQVTVKGGYSASSYMTNLKPFLQLSLQSTSTFLQKQKKHPCKLIHSIFVYILESTLPYTYCCATITICSIRPCKNDY